MVGAMNNPLEAGLHRGVADEAETRKREPGQHRDPSPIFARREDGGGDERGGEREMRDPRLAEFGAGQDGGDHARIGRGGPVVRHRRRLQREPQKRGDQHDEARREGEAPQLRRERAPEILRRVKLEEGARAEHQHRRHEMDEAAEGKGGHTAAQALPPPKGRSKERPSFDGLWWGRAGVGGRAEPRSQKPRWPAAIPPASRGSSPARRAEHANDFGMARPLTLTRPVWTGHKGGGNAPPLTSSSRPWRRPSSARLPRRRRSGRGTRP